MSAHLIRAAVALAIIASAGPPPARADIYTWVDASGRTNISNLEPPEGVVVTGVIKSNAGKSAARTDSARDAEVQALAEKVKQLQQMIDDAQSAPPPAPMPVAYPYAPPAPVVQYVVYVAPPQMQSAEYPAPQAANACDPSWAGCELWWNPGFYPASVFVVGTPGYRRFHPDRGGHQIVAARPTPRFGAGPWR